MNCTVVSFVASCWLENGQLVTPSSLDTGGGGGGEKKNKKKEGLQHCTQVVFLQSHSFYKNSGLVQASVVTCSRSIEPSALLFVRERGQDGVKWGR